MRRGRQQRAAAAGRQQGGPWPRAWGGSGACAAAPLCECAGMRPAGCARGRSRGTARRNTALESRRGGGAARAPRARVAGRGRRREGTMGSDGFGGRFAAGPRCAFGARCWTSSSGGTEADEALPGKGWDAGQGHAPVYGRWGGRVRSAARVGLVAWGQLVHGERGGVDVDVSFELGPFLRRAPGCCIMYAVSQTV